MRAGAGTRCRPLPTGRRAGTAHAGWPALSRVPLVAFSAAASGAAAAVRRRCGGPGFSGVPRPAPLPCRPSADAGSAACMQTAASPNQRLLPATGRPLRRPLAPLFVSAPTREMPRPGTNTVSWGWARASPACPAARPSGRAPFPAGCGSGHWARVFGCVPVVADNSAHPETVPFAELRYRTEAEAAEIMRRARRQVRRPAAGAARACSAVLGGGLPGGHAQGDRGARALAAALPPPARPGATSAPARPWLHAPPSLPATLFRTIPALSLAVAIVLQSGRPGRAAGAACRAGGAGRTGA